VDSVRLYHATQATYDLTIGGLHTYYVLAGSTPVLVHNCGLDNNRPEEIQKIEVEGAAKRGVGPVSLPEGGGMDALRDAIGGASDFKWAVTMEGELKVMPAFAQGNGWPRIELAHTVFAGVGGKLRAAGSGTFMEGFPAFITNQSGHFLPPNETLPIGEAAFDRAGVDVIATPFSEG